MKTRPTLTFLALAACTLPLIADTIVLKDGTTLEGTVIRQDDTSYTVEVQVTGSIKDERVIPKADVERIKEAKPEIAAFEAIANLTPTPDALTEEEYSERIATVEKYLKDHRAGAKSKEAKEMLATLKSEANEVLAGGVKVNGKIIPPADYRANAYAIDASIEAARIKRLIDEARYLEALRAFSDFDRDFKNTGAHEEIMPLITRVIRTYVNGIAQSLTTFDARTKQRQIGLERMSSDDRRVSEQAIAEEMANLEKRLAAEKAAKIGWVSTHPFFKPSLEETVNFGKREIDRLTKQTTKSDVDGGKAYRDALSAIQRGDKAEVTAAISAAKAAGVAQRYLDTLESAAKARGLAP
jgi:hypothetical protein